MTNFASWRRNFGGLVAVVLLLWSSIPAVGQVGPDASAQSCCVADESFGAALHRQTHEDDRIPLDSELGGGPCGGASHEVTVELILFADYTARYGGEASRNAKAVIDLINPVFRTSLNVNLRVLNVHAFVGSDPFGSSTSDQSLIVAVQTWKNANITTTNLGTVVAFTSRQLDTPSKGIAFVSGVCGPMGVSLVSDFGASTATAFITRVVTAHMLGHNLGMGHDGLNNGCSPSGYIMSANYSTDSLTFSTCSQSYWLTLRFQGALCVGPPAPELGDADCNGRIDLKDFITFPDCLGGPTDGLLDDSCAIFDFEGEIDVDLFDYGELQNAFTGNP